MSKLDSPKWAGISVIVAIVSIWFAPYVNEKISEKKSEIGIILGDVRGVSLIGDQQGHLKWNSSEIESIYRVGFVLSNFGDAPIEESDFYSNVSVNTVFPLEIVAVESRFYPASVPNVLWKKIRDNYWEMPRVSLDPNESMQIEVLVTSAESVEMSSNKMFRSIRVGGRIKDNVLEPQLFSAEMSLPVDQGIIWNIRGFAGRHLGLNMWLFFSLALLLFANLTFFSIPVLIKWRIEKRPIVCYLVFAVVLSAFCAQALFYTYDPQPFMNSFFVPVSILTYLGLLCILMFSEKISMALLR